MPVEILKQQIKKVFPSLWKEEYKQATKKHLLEVIIPQLNSEDMKWEKCSYLQEKNEIAKRSFEIKKLVFQSCGTHVADKERYQHNMDIDGSSTSSSSGSSSEEDSDNEE